MVVIPDQLVYTAMVDINHTNALHLDFIIVLCYNIPIDLRHKWISNYIISGYQ